MDDVEVIPHEQAAERGHPPEVEIGTGPEAVHLGPVCLDEADESVFGLEDEGDLVVEGLVVPVGHGVDQKVLGSTVPQALDRDEDSRPSL